MTSEQKKIILTNIKNKLKVELKSEGKKESEINSHIKYTLFATELYLNDCSEEQIEDMVKRIEKVEI